LYHILLASAIDNAMETLGECERVVVDDRTRCSLHGVALAGCPIILATGFPVDEIFDSRHVRTWLSVEHNAPNAKAEGRNGKQSLSSVSITTEIECIS
jgi:hypothetical protein